MTGISQATRAIRIIGPGVQSFTDLAEGRTQWVRVECPTCQKFFCRAAPGSTVEVICSRCKTESITTVAA